MVFFPSVYRKKTMGLTPSNGLFGCVVRVLCPIWISSKIGSIQSVPTLTWKISCSRIFPKKLIVQTEREKFNASSKSMTWILHWNYFFFGFWPNFFHFFQNCFFFFLFLFFWPTKWIFMTLVLIFSKFGMYLTYKTGFGHIFHGFWPGACTQPLGPGTGTKSIFRCW